MKNLPWFIAAIGLGLAVWVINSTPAPQYATGSDALEDAANKASNWGSKQRVRGTGGRFVGKVKQGVASLTGDPNLSDEGTGQEAAGTVTEAIGKVAQAAGQTIHDLNR